LWTEHLARLLITVSRLRSPGGPSFVLRAPDGKPSFARPYGKADCTFLPRARASTLRDAPHRADRSGIPRRRGHYLKRSAFFTYFEAGDLRARRCAPTDPCKTRRLCNRHSRCSG